jgi:hypothetical protein
LGTGTGAGAQAARSAEKMRKKRDEDSPPFVNVFFEFFFGSGRELV